jgi:hypothetical protein
MEVALQAQKMRRAGLIYGIVCGAIIFPLAVFACSMFVLAIPAFASRGYGLFLYALILMAIGALAGAAIGFWVGHTCGGEGAGIRCGAVMGAFAGLVVGLIQFEGAAVVVVDMAIYALFGAGLGWIIGRMVDASIGWD